MRKKKEEKGKTPKAQKKKKEKNLSAIFPALHTRRDTEYFFFFFFPIFFFFFRFVSCEKDFPCQFKGSSYSIEKGHACIEGTGMRTTVLQQKMT